MFPALLALLPSLFQMGQSYAQKQKADNLKNSNYVPPSVQSGVDIATQGAAASTSPGYANQLQKVKTVGANSISKAKQVAGDPNQLQSAVQQVDARERDNTRDLSNRNQEFQFQNRGQLMKWLGIRGASEQRSTDAYNATKSALIGASQQNMYNGITGAAAVGIKAIGSNDNTGTSGSLVGKTGKDLVKSMGDRTSFTDDEKAYLKSMGYSVDGGGSSFGSFGKFKSPSELSVSQYN